GGHGDLVVRGGSEDKGVNVVAGARGASFYGLWGFGSQLEMVLESYGVSVYRKLAVGLWAEDATNILQVKQNSVTDPIADSWTTYSSRRWKRDIRQLDGALDKVTALRGVAFQWKTNGEEDIGLIAEEVAPIVPEVVRWEEGEDGQPQAIDYARL